MTDRKNIIRAKMIVIKLEEIAVKEEDEGYDSEYRLEAKMLKNAIENNSKTGIKYYIKKYKEKFNIG